MNTFTLFCRLLVVFCLTSTVITPVYAIAANENTINAVLGDISFVKRFGYAPDSRTDAQLRIRTHLEYVGQLLRTRDVKNLSADQQRKRSYLLDKLDEYRTAGRFPKNIAYTTHRPCFIDADRAICAVGYLIEQSAGRNLAERINAAHQYDYISTMTMPELHAWVRSSGLTVDECAMIQPTYPGEPAFNPFLSIHAIQPISTIATSKAFDLKLYIQLLMSTRAAIMIERSRGDNMFRLSVKSITRASISVASGSIEYQLDGYEITVSVPASITAATYWIHIRDGFASSPQDPSYYYGRFLPYTISASTATSVVRLGQSNNYEIFPNPAHETFTFQNGAEQARVRLVTALGEEVRSEKIVQAEERHTFDLRGLVSGVYFVETRNSAGRRVQKVIKY